MAKKKAPSKGVWGWGPAKPAAPSISPAAKAQIEANCLTFLEKMKPKWIQPPQQQFNYTSAIDGKWYRHYFYFCATLRNDDEEVPREMELKFARLEYVGSNQFNLAYFRHTGQWFQVFESLSLEESLKAIEENAFFWP